MTDGKNADAFRTISEAAEMLDLPQHVLRFWETRFSQIRPMKRAGGRRYYRPEDVELLSAIRHLLYAEGYTIRGVQRLLKQPKGVKSVIALVEQLRISPGKGASIVAALIAQEQGFEQEAEHASAHTSAYAMEEEDAPDGQPLPQLLSQAIAPPVMAMHPAASSSRPPAAAGRDRHMAEQLLPRLRWLAAEVAECRRLLDAARIAGANISGANTAR